MQSFYFKSSPTTGYVWEGDLLYHAKSEFQDIKVIWQPEMGNTLILDDCVMLTQKDEYQYHEMITHPNCLQLPAHNRALIIGGGDGLCAEELLKYPFKCVELVEIDRTVSVISEQYFKAQLGNTFQNPRFLTHYEDALKFFNHKKIFYDFIALDLTDPGDSHAHPLYTGEFYQTCQRHMTEQSILAVQIGCPILLREHFIHCVRKLKELFQYVAIYGKYMRCYGTWQYFAACSDTIHVLKPNMQLIEKNSELFDTQDLKLYNKKWHQAMLVADNELNSILG